MKTAKELELSLLLKESHIQQLNLKLNDLENRINKAIECINTKLTINSDYVDYDFGTELLRQELIEILKGSDNE